MAGMGGMKPEMDEHAELGVMPPRHAALLIGGGRTAGGRAPASGCDLASLT